MTQQTTSRTLHDQALLIAERVVEAGPAAEALAEEIVALAEYGGTAYATAVEEIRLLRGLCAHAALSLEADLGYASFPKSRRTGAQERVEHLKDAARGRVQAVTASMNLTPLYRLLGVPSTLTRSTYEASLPQR